MKVALLALELIVAIVAIAASTIVIWRNLHKPNSQNDNTPNSQDNTSSTPNNIRRL